MNALDGFLIGWLDAIELNGEDGTVHIPDEAQRMLIRRGWMKYTGPKDWDGGRLMKMTPLGTKVAAAFVREAGIYSGAGK